MRNFIWNVIMLVCLYGCSDKNDAIARVNKDPEIFIRYRDTLSKNVTDSIKLSAMGVQGYGVIDIVFNDPNGKLKSLDFTGASGKVYLNDTLINDGRLPWDGGNRKVKYFPSGPGITKIDFTIKDLFDKTDIATYNVFSFNNLPPVANLNYTELGNLSPLEYLIDASSSYDPDFNFGGGLSGFIYTIEGKPIPSTSNTIKHIFSQAGIYTVSVQAIDNDGEKSVLKTIQIPVK